MSWPRVRLRDLGDWFGGGTPSKGMPEYWRDGTIPWLSPKDMKVARLVGTQDHLTEAAIANSAARLVPATSVAVVARSGILEHSLPVALVPFATTLNQDMKALLPHPHLLPDWVAWHLRSDERAVLHHCRKAGTTVASLDWTKTLNWRIALPPLSEQRRIVEIIEDHFSRLDAADADLVRARTRAEGFMLRCRREVFAGSGIEAEPLLRHASIANGQTPKGFLAGLETSGDVPYFKVGDMNLGDSRLMATSRTYASTAHLRVHGVHVRPSGTVLIPKRGGAIATNKVRILPAPGSYDLNVMGLVPAPTLLSDYLWHWLCTVDLAAVADGSNVPQINAAQIQGLRLPVPSHSVQAAVCRQLDEYDAALTSGLGVLTFAKQRAEVLRRSILAAAFSGRLTGSASDADRIDELASAAPPGAD